MGHKEITYAIENVSDGRAFKDALEGWAYHVGIYNSALAAGATENVFIENPVDSGVAIMPFYSVASNGEITFRKTDTVTVDTAGTTIPSRNRLLSDGDSAARTEKNIVFSGGEAWNTKIAGSGKASAANTVALLTPDVVLEPGDNMVFELTNTSTDASSATLDVPYIEIPLSEIAEL